MRTSVIGQSGHPRQVPVERGGQHQVHVPAMAAPQDPLQHQSPGEADGSQLAGIGAVYLDLCLIFRLLRFSLVKIKSTAQKKNISQGFSLAI